MSMFYIGGEMAQSPPGPAQIAHHRRVPGPAAVQPAGLRHAGPTTAALDGRPAGARDGVPFAARPPRSTPAPCWRWPALGLLINEKVGIVNLGAEGMMLCAPSPVSPRWCTPATTGWAWRRHGAPGGRLALVFGVLVIWLNTNQFATGLALTPVRRRPLGVSAPVRAEKIPERPVSIPPVLGDIPLLGPALFSTTRWST